MSNRLIWDGGKYYTMEELILKISKEKNNKNKKKNKKVKTKEWSVNTEKDSRARSQKGICK